MTASVAPAAGGGVVMLAGGTHQADGWYDEGSSITLTMAPQKGYRLSYWLVDGQFVRTERISLSMDRPHSVRAQF